MNKRGSLGRQRSVYCSPIFQLRRADVNKLRLCAKILDSAAPKKHPVERLISHDGNHTQCLRRWSSSAGFKLFVFAGVVSIQHWN